MTKNYLENIKELFANLDTCTPEKMMAFVEETKGYLAEMKERLTSEDEYICTKAIEQMQEVQSVIMHSLQKICDRTGLTMEQLGHVAGQALSPEHKEMWSKADMEVAEVILPKAKERKSKTIQFVG